MNNSPEKPPRDSADTKRIFGLLMLEAGFEFLFLIGVPLVGFIFLGRWLDAKFNHHFFVVVGLILALPVSALLVYRRTKDYQKLLNK